MLEKNLSYFIEWLIIEESPAVKMGEEISMYCIRCGKKLEDGVKYCTRCGAPVDDQTKTRTGIPTQEQPQEDDFTIRIPQDDMQAEAAQHIQHMMEQTTVPDDAGDDSFTRAMVREEIRQAMAQDIPDDAGDDSFTRTMVREDIQEAMAQSTAEVEPDDAGDEAYTRMVPRDEIRAALAEQQEQQEQEQPLDVDAIPDIPVPPDFVAQEAPRYYTPPAPYIPAEHTVHRVAQEEDEPLMSGRGLLFVALIVVLFFAIAVGAFVLALNSTGSGDAGSGSGSAEVGFWSAGDSE